jgi:CheY-like chemotaxis protein
VVLLLKHNAEEKGIEFSVEYDPRMFDIFFGDPNHIRQVLINLVGNGIKFTHKGRVKICVTGKAKAGNKTIAQIAVEDTGVGIRKKEMARLFDAFTQADGSMTRKYGGAGLGLAISRKLIKAMNGEILVESKVGVGSTFTVKIPLGREKSDGKKDPQPQIECAEPKQPLNARILLVEDSYVNQQVAREILRRFGCRVEVACNGREALDKLAKQEFDVVLMDCQMPVMDGYEATVEIRKREGESRHTPVIAMTAHALEGARATCLSAGMDDYLSKPVDPDRLFHILSKWMNSDIQPPPAEADNEALPAKRDASDVEGEIFEMDRLAKAIGKNVTVMQKILIAFLNDVPARLGELEDGLSRQDAEQIRRTAHTLKGAAANIGAERLRHAAYAVEMLAGNAELDSIPGKVEGLYHRYNELKETVKKIDWSLTGS